MQLQCPGFSIKGLTTDIRYGSPFQRKWDKTPLKKKKKKDVSNKSQLGVRVQVIQSSELPVHLNTFQQTVDGSCSGLRVRQVLGEQTQTSQTGTRKEVIPNQGLSCCRVSEPSSTTQFRSYRWSLVETFLSIVMDFFFFQMPQRQFLTDAHLLWVLSVHLSSTFRILSNWRV